MSRIQDYSIIGDCRSAALVSRDGSIDWLCWPRFDSPSVFAALLDPGRGGHWKIAPATPITSERRYTGESNVLETSFHTATGSVRLTDLMPVASEEFKHSHLLPEHEIIRRIECVSGEVLMDFDFQPRPHYARKPARIRKHGNLGFCAEGGRGVYWLRGTVPLEVREDGIRADFVIRAGEAICFSLTFSEESPQVLPPVEIRSSQTIARSVAWWEQWARQCTYQGPNRDVVIRSALVLKLMAYAPSGAIIAAATTSLPERIGSDLNWDYRYCWLRDAALTVRALMERGFRDEADSFLDWILHSTRLTQPELRVLYTLYGELLPAERELAHLSGYRGSLPVRVGNEARDQLQLDVYGEVIDGVAQYLIHGGQIDRTTQKVLIGFGQYVANHWNQPDEGIWEPRTGRQHHTHSRLLCWTALNRLVELGRRGVLKQVPVGFFDEQQEQIARQLCERAWNPLLQSYVSTLDGNEVDATLLLISWYGFERADSPRMRSTYRLLRERLGAGNGLLYRYRLDPPEGAFGICSFWGAEYLALGGGTLEEARSQFRQLLAYRSDLGLYAEEIDPETGDALGNFPQAFTHVGLINAALSIQNREQGVRPLTHRSEGFVESMLEGVKT